jgi:hypothetical protein
MYASSGPSARLFNRSLNVKTKADIAEHEMRIARIRVITIAQTDCPMDLSYELQRQWLLRWCVINRATCYSAPREKFSEREAREQAVREGVNTVVVEDLS